MNNKEEATKIKTEAEAGEGENLEKIFTDNNFVINDDYKAYYIKMIKNYLAFLEKDTDSSNHIEVISKAIIKLEDDISYYLNEILHHPKFQKLEGSWRGVEYLMKNLELSTNLKVRIFNANLEEIFNDLTTCLEFDQSYLFKKIYEEEYGTLGGLPYTAMMMDNSISRKQSDIILLKKISEVMAAAHCPLFMGTDPSIFDLSSFKDINKPIDLKKVFESEELASLRSFKSSDESKYITLLLPRVMARVPYGSKTMSIPDLNFEESVTGYNENEYTWMNPAYVYLCNVGRSFANYKWFTSICGVNTGGKVDNLPIHIYETKNGDKIMQCPTEISITDRREKELDDLGFAALCHAKGEAYSVFFGGKSTYQPPLFDKDSANANAALSAKTPYILCASRFAHYVKCIMRDKIGEFNTKETIIQYLNNWLTDYILLNKNGSYESKCKYPLSAGNVIIDDIPGKPGYYTGTVFITPHFQMEAIEISMRLVAGTSAKA
ncbi:hypothetical protein AB836_00740 [Rickettsiales bacterium (ex Bugula neritina AB1)]|nr:hypothetical protein AB836_00740 [Rickettsiales bacterium (ex Bugula neritina AB1)]